MVLLISLYINTKYIIKFVCNSYCKHAILIINMNIVVVVVNLSEGYYDGP